MQFCFANGFRHNQQTCSLFRRVHRHQELPGNSSAVRFVLDCNPGPPGRSGRYFFAANSFANNSSDSRAPSSDNTTDFAFVAVGNVALFVKQIQHAPGKTLPSASSRVVGQIHLEQSENYLFQFFPINIHIAPLRCKQELRVFQELRGQRPPNAMYIRRPRPSIACFLPQVGIKLGTVGGKHRN